MTSPESRMQEMKAAFEAAMRLPPFSFEETLFDWAPEASMPNGFYWEGFVQNAYLVWQAAWSARTMPVEAISWMIGLAKDNVEHAIYRGDVSHAAKVTAHIAALTQLLEQGK